MYGSSHGKKDKKARSGTTPTPVTALKILHVTDAFPRARAFFLSLRLRSQYVFVQHLDLSLNNRPILLPLQE